MRSCGMQTSSQGCIDEHKTLMATQQGSTHCATQQGNIFKRSGTLMSTLMNCTHLAFWEKKFVYKNLREE
eukprot:TRINITY_DN3262_c0_g1_i1.p1 TRINITY_DN3262_c0_g1~~TRINITY_DN3262_c0_g1_i1.p1  ORF type:complete len:70 (-),score=5.19 TRINITY_DN3262_c0_g1_i1:60-269(-)